jgi:membrane protein YqaA with SNARE-associated domain
MDSLSTFVVEYGGIGLLAVSFVAATLVPLSSEAAVYAAVALGMSSPEVLLWASLGNCLGVAFNYGLGRWGSRSVLRRALDGGSGRVAVRWTQRYGKWALLLSWLPIVGDPLTFVAGIMRVHPTFFAATAFPVRVIRYVIVIAVAGGGIG